jgi:hypothetical protein
MQGLVLVAQTVSPSARRILLAEEVAGDKIARATDAW